MNVKIIFYSLMLLSCYQGEAALSDWWEPGGNSHSKDVPFSRFYVEPHCRRIFGDLPDFNARTTIYDFMLFAHPGEFGIALKGNDDILGLKISLELAHNTNHKPVHCTIRKDGRLYYSSDIWMTRVNNKKTIYVISFKESEANLVIYKSKDRAVTGQWALLRERPLKKED